MILRAGMQLGACAPGEQGRASAAHQPADQSKACDQDQQGGGVEGHGVFNFIIGLLTGWPLAGSRVIGAE